MKKIIGFFLCLFTSLITFSQTTIITEGFEGGSAGYSVFPAFTTGSGGSLGASTKPAWQIKANTITGVGGSNSIHNDGAQQISGVGETSVTLNSTSFSGYSNLVYSASVYGNAGFMDGENFTASSTDDKIDYVIMDYKIDAGSYITATAVYGYDCTNSDKRDGLFSEDTDGDFDGDECTNKWTSNSAFKTLSKNIGAPAGSNITLRVRMASTFTLEDILVDDIKLTGTGSALSVSINKTDVNCSGGNDGTATANASNGTTPYTYLWSNGASTATISGLFAGTYTTTVTDAAATTATASITVTTPTSGTSSVSVNSNVSCNGLSDGQLTANASGGTSPYTYSWNDGQTSAVASSLAAGTYTVTFTDANGCTWVDNKSITEPAALVASATPQNVSSSGGSDGQATASQTGGTAAYTYSWNNGATSATASSLPAGTYSVTITDANGCTDSASTAVTEPAAISLSASKTDISCFGSNDGTATANASNGTTPYTYLWSNGASTATISGLFAGTYTTTVTDAAATTATASITVTTPTSATWTTSVLANVSCNGGSDGRATMSVAGATPPYTYSWSNGETSATANSLSAGTSTVTLTDANGCGPYIDNVTISEPTAISATSSSTNVSTNGGSNGSATASGSGGTSPYTYAWSNGATTSNISNLTAGTYTVSITDNNGCGPATVAETISQPAPSVNVTISSSSNISCFGSSDGSATASGSSGTSPYTYLWSTGATTSIISGLFAGTYTTTCTDNVGTTATASITITTPTSGTSTVTVNSNVSCNGLSDGQLTANASGGTSPYTYSWNDGQTSAVASSLAAGTYTVTFTDANGCTWVDNKSITEPAALVASATPQNVSSSGGSDGQATASQTGGTAAYTYSWNNGATSATASSLPAGTYSVTITDANGCTDSASALVTEPAAVSVGMSKTDITCAGANDGTVTATASSGTSPYFYNWSSGDTLSTGGLSTITGKSAGTYTVTVTDAANSTATASITITTPTSATNSTSVNNNVSCNGFNDGSATISMAGGTAPYTFLWSNGVTSATNTSMSAGTYTVTGTDNNGCTVVDNATITEPTALVASATPQNVSLNGGSDGQATASQTGGTAAYTYSWNNGATFATASSLSAGTYSVTITDNNGCTDSASTSVNQPPATITITSFLPVTANIGDTITINGTSFDGNSTNNTVFFGATKATVISSTQSEIQAIVPTGATNNFIEITNTSTNQVAQSLLKFNPTYVGKSTLDDGDFDAKATITNTSGSDGLRLADFNNDGKTDLVVGQSSQNAIAVYPNVATSGSISSSSFGTPISLSVSNSGLPSLQAVGDVDGDGKLDIVSSSRNSNHTLHAISIFRNTTSGSTISFGAELSYSATGESHPEVHRIELADIDGDGKLDIIIKNGWGYNNYTVGTHKQVMGIYLNTSTGPGNISFAAIERHYLIDQNNYIQFADIDNDGKVDLISSDQNNIGLHKNTSTPGNISFATPVIFAVSTGYAMDIETSDLDGDGKLDIIVANQSDGAIHVWRNNATQGIIDSTTLTGYQQIQSASGLNGLYSIATGDLNGDGKPEIIAAHGHPPSIPTGYRKVTVYPNSSTVGTISTGTAFQLVPSGQSPRVRVGDMDGDGILDIVVSNANAVDLFRTNPKPPCVPYLSIATDNNVSCNGLSDGAASVSTTGGTAPFTYSWSNGATNASITGLATGTYTVSVTDNYGCTDIASTTITQPTSLSATTTSSSNVSCNGLSDGTASIGASGGTIPYYYLWSNGDTSSTAFSLAAGTYSVTITDGNGCTVTDITNITEPAALVASAINTIPSSGTATDGSATASATGGTSAYTYAWNTGATTATAINLATGTYSVTITDANGCTDSASTTLISYPSASIVVDSNISCNGFLDGGATANASSGTTPYTYSWSNSATTASITGVAAGTYTVTVTDNNGLTSTNSSTITQPTSLSATGTSSSNVSCNGLSDGTASIGASGGTSPYYYLWSNGDTSSTAFSLAAGTYTVTITDGNGCTLTDVTSITEPATLVSATVVDSNVSCNTLSDGGATSSATGGTMPYTYAWSNSATTASITGVVSGTYSVTITDNNGCTSTNSTSITEPATLVAVTAVDSNVSCNTFTDGGATASANGGTTPYTYAWSNSATTAAITGVAAGTYTVTITDNNACTSSSSLTITEPAVLVAASVVDSNITCNGLSDGGATASAIGGTTPYTFAWSNSATTASITGVAAGTYTVTITDNNACTSSSSLTITEPAVLIAASVVDSNITCNGLSDAGATASATGGTAPYTYSWSNSATTASITGVTAGTYTVTITDNNACTSTSSSTITEPSVLVASSVVDSNATCLGFTDGGVSSSAMGGTTPYTYAWSNAATTASITGVANGTYTLTITDNNGCTVTSSSTVIVVDTVKPTVLTQNVTVYLDAAGAASITTADVDNGSTDICNVVSLSLSKTSFTCSDVGANTVYLIATDVNNNVDSMMATVTVIDSIKPTVLTQNVTVYLDAAGAASITTADVDNGTTDICNVVSLSLSKTSFTCAEVGANTVYLIATDVNNNVDSMMATVTVIDSIKPTVVTQNINAYLDATGNVSITTADVDNGTTDICGAPTLSLNVSSFTCAEVGANTVYLIATDVNNNVDSMMATVTVIDSIKPTVITQNINAYLDATGNVSITTADVDNGTTDICGAPTLSIDVSSFTCAEVGANTVYLIATDVNNNVDSMMATVTVIDSIKPTVVTQNINAYLDATGNVSITTVDVDNGTTDICGRCQSLSLSKTSFTCAEVGANTVTLTATDVNSNINSATAIVTVIDSIKPTVITQAVTVYLDAAGAASITTADVDNGTTDICGAPTLSLDITSFGCS